MIGFPYWQRHSSFNGGKWNDHPFLLETNVIFWTYCWVNIAEKWLDIYFYRLFNWDHMFDFERDLFEETSSFWNT